MVAVVAPLRGEAASFPLREAVERALSYYPSLAASVAERERAAAATGEARALNYPTLALRGSLNHYQEPMIVFPIHAFTPNLTPPFDRTLYQLLGELSYTLFDGGARSSKIAGSLAEEEAAEAIANDTRQRLLSAVVGAYLRVLGDARVLAAHDRSIAALELELSRVRKLFDVGKAASVEVLRVEAAVASARAERVAKASSLDRAERSLARLTGLPAEKARADELVPVSLVAPALEPRSELRERALSTSPVVHAAREKGRAAGTQVDAARSGRFPTVHLSAAYVDYASFSGIHQLEWNVGLRVAYPLFDGGMVSNATARAEAGARRAAEELRLAELEVDEAVDGALSALAEARARLESLETAVRRFEEVTRVERLRLETGVGTQTEYLRAEADLLQTRAQAIQAEYAVAFARTELARITGGLAPEWVTSHLRSAP